MTRTYDAEYIKGIVTDPVNYDYLVDDGSPSQQDYEPVMNEGVYYIDLDGKGVAMFFRTNHIAFDMHVCMKPDCRGKEAYQLGRDAVNWIKENTCCLKINARIPVINKKVLNYAYAIGFEHEGIDRQGFMKDGILYDQHILGITRE